MNMTTATHDEILPPSDAATALLRMPVKDRLPKFRPNSLNPIEDVPEAVKDALRSIGR